MNNSRLWIIGSMALSLASCVVRSKSEPTVTSPFVTEKIQLAPPNAPEVIKKKELDRQHHVKTAGYIMGSTDDVNLRNWLEMRLLSIDLAERRANELRQKEARTPFENRELAEVEAALEEEARELDSRIALTYQQYRVNFVKSDKVDLSERPLEDLLAIKQEVIADCRDLRQIEVLGWSCAKGAKKKKVTQRVSDDRANIVAAWLVSEGKCQEKAIGKKGMGIYTEDTTPGLSSDVLENLRSKHRIVDILIRREFELSPPPSVEKNRIPQGVLIDGSRTYVNADLGFRISLPYESKGWQLSPDPYGYNGVSVILYGRGTQIQVLAHQLPGSEVGGGLEEMGQRLSAPKRDRGIGYKEMKTGLVRRPTGDYYELQYQVVVGTGEMRFCERLFFHRRILTMVTAMATPERWQMEEPTILQIMDSMVLE